MRGRFWPATAATLVSLPVGTGTHLVGPSGLAVAVPVPVLASDAGAADPDVAAVRIEMRDRSEPLEGDAAGDGSRPAEPLPVLLTGPLAVDSVSELEPEAEAAAEELADRERAATERGDELGGDAAGGSGKGNAKALPASAAMPVPEDDRVRRVPVPEPAGPPMGAADAPEACNPRANKGSAGIAPAPLVAAHARGASVAPSPLPSSSLSSSTSP